ncbi:hypothetical protein B296_00049771 [Ensete ventricosum]|uniref:Uncharacterized protein n=1 Tax=Ensete ventricosum TaxID=4639 RepID=A0A426X6J3_ENSVE|nr:hypothetical protein B296_00049771 [Ensete ventricosum]
MHPLRFPNSGIRAKPVGAAPVGRNAACKHNHLQRGARKGGDAARRGGRPLAEWLLVGKGSRRRGRCSGDDDSAEGARGWEHGGDSGTDDTVAGDHAAW